MSNGNCKKYYCSCRDIFTCFLTFEKFPKSINGVTKHDYYCVTRNEIISYIFIKYGDDIGSVIIEFLPLT